MCTACRRRHLVATPHCRRAVQHPTLASWPAAARDHRLRRRDHHSNLRGPLQGRQRRSAEAHVRQRAAPLARFDRANNVRAPLQGFQDEEGRPQGEPIAHCAHTQSGNMLRTAWAGRCDPWPGHAASAGQVVLPPRLRLLRHPPRRRRTRPVAARPPRCRAGVPPLAHLPGPDRRLRAPLYARGLAQDGHSRRAQAQCRGAVPQRRRHRGHDPDNGQARRHHVLVRTPFPSLFCALGLLLTEPVTRRSCCLVDSLTLPAYRADKPCETVVQPLEARCACNMSLKECLDRDGVLLQVRPPLTPCSTHRALADDASVAQRAGILDPPSSEARFLGVGRDDKSPAYSSEGTDYVSSVPFQRRGTSDSGFQDGGT